MRALKYAERAINLDRQDGLGHWSLSRAQFLDQEHDSALQSINEALKLNSNFAQAHYAKGFICAHSSAPETAIKELALAERLSPYDPLLFAIKSSRALSLIQQGEFNEASHWAIQATKEPNAHFHIYAIAAASLVLVNKDTEAKQFVDVATDMHPNYSQKDFFQSFPYKNKTDRMRMSESLLRAGLPIK